MAPQNLSKLPTRIPPDFPRKLVRFGVIVLTVAGTAWATLYQGYGLPESTGVAGFFAFIALALLDYSFDRELMLAGYRSLKVLAIILMVTAFFAGAFSLFSFNGISAAHRDSAIRSAVETHILHIKSSFLALLLGFSSAAGYAFWKFKATRFAEGRVGLLKDLILQVNQVLSREESSVKEKREEAVNHCLSALLAAMDLSPWQWLFRKLRIVNRSFCTCTVRLLEPDEEKKRYKIIKTVSPKDASKAAVEVLEFIEKNHFPVFLNEEMFLERVSLAKGRNPKGWQETYFNFKDRGSFISAVGWIAEKRKTLLSHDSYRCKAFDISFMDRLEEEEFDKSDISWARIRSFIGCPLSSLGKVGGVVFVTKSIPHGFVEEDREAVIAIAELINVVLTATSPAILAADSAKNHDRLPADEASSSPEMAPVESTVPPSPPSITDEGTAN